MTHETKETKSGKESPTRRGVLKRAGVVAGMPFLPLTVGRAKAASPVGPHGVHLSFTDDPTTTATVIWFTDGLRDPGTNVEYGATRSLGQSVTGSSGPAPFADTLVHEATITGLDPGQEVFYRVGSASGHSPTRRFHTATVDDTFTFTMYSDQGVTPDAEAVTARTKAQSPDLHLITGDTSYAEGDPAIWDRYFEQVEPLLATTPTMAAVGNHEYDAPGTGAAGYESRFAHPGREYWYSFDYGNVHFVAVDSNGETITEGKAGNELAWLEQDLAAAQAARARGEIDWIIVFQHQPLYSSEDSRRNNVLRIVPLEPIYQRYGVDLLLAGHNHLYERSLPMVAGQPTNDQQRYTREQVGFMQVVNGGGGNGLYEFRPEYAFQSWSAAHALEYATVAFEVEGDRIVGTAYEAHSGDVLDKFVVMAGET